MSKLGGRRPKTPESWMPLIISSGQNRGAKRTDYPDIRQLHGGPSGSSPNEAGYWVQNADSQAQHLVQTIHFLLFLPRTPHHG